MFLGKEGLARYGSEILHLCREELGEEVPLKGFTYFGIISNETLQAVAAVKCYMGSWYLRACVVKPEFRGQGFQRELIQERIEYLKSKTDIVRVSVRPENLHSIQNIEGEGFEFEKRKN